MPENIIARKQAEEKLRLSEERFRTIFEEAPLGVALIDSLTGQIHEVNPKFASIAGRTREEMAHMNWMSIIHPDDVQEDLENMSEKKDGFNLDKRYVKPDGSSVWVNMTIAPVTTLDKENRYHLCMVEDITNRKQQEERWYQSEIIVSSSTGIIALMDKNYTYLAANPAYLKIVQKTYDEVIGNKAVNIFGEEFFNKVIRPRAERCMNGEEVHFHDWFDFPFSGKRYLEVNYFPHYGVNKEIRGFVVSGKDITERKRAEEELERYRAHLEERVEERTQELEKSQKQLLHSEKLASLGKLTGAISHEFNNPLHGLRNILDILSSSVPSEKEARLAEIGKAECDRMARMITGLRDFYKPSSGKTSPTCINKCLEGILTLQIKLLNEKNIQVSRNFSDKLPPVEAVEDQIKQVLLNIIQNCADSISGEGQITVTTEAQSSNVIIKIADTGCGISEDHIKDIFEPFFSTKTTIQGTGLGLSISYGIIRDHGGDIKVESELDKGTTFIITLPVKRE